MEWLEPWSSTESMDARFHDGFVKQLQVEVASGHELHGLPVRLIARGNGDDTLFEILDGSGRVAVVHLTWSKKPEKLPWPRTRIFANLQTFEQERMIPEHNEWSGI